MIDFSRHFIQIQTADILCGAMRQHLLQELAPLKWIIEIYLICAPYQVAWGLNLSMHNLIIQQIVLLTPGTKKRLLDDRRRSILFIFVRSGGHHRTELVTVHQHAALIAI